MLKEKKQHTGFTIIELLVVIAIISLVMSVTMPGLSKAKSSAKKLQCSDNMRQIRLAMDFYAADYDNYIVTSREMLFAHSESEIKGVWHVVLAPYVQHSQIKDLIADAYPKLWRCPEDKDPYPQGFRGYPHKVGMTSYALNGYYTQADDSRQAVRFGPGANFRFPQIPNPSQCMLMAETSYCGQIYDAAHPNTITANLRTDGHHRMTSGFYHDGSMNIIFVDGHLETVRGIDCEPDESQIPWPYKNGGYMFWPTKRLVTAAESAAFWGPGY